MEMSWRRKRRGLKYIYLHLETRKTGPEQHNVWSFSILPCSGSVSHGILSYKTQRASFPCTIVSIEQPRHHQSLRRRHNLVNTKSYTSALYHCPTSIINIGLVTCHIWLFCLIECRTVGNSYIVWQHSSPILLIHISGC